MKITLKKYRELVLASKFLERFPASVIAGGLARDLINGRGFKDVDIFLAAPEPEDLSRISVGIACFAAESNLKPEFLDNHYKTKTLARIGFSNLDICLLGETFKDPESLVKCFDMVSSQAWLEPIKGGFEVKATNLFHELNKRKVLGIYEYISGSGVHVERILEKYPDYLPLNLKQTVLRQPIDDGFDEVPF